MTSVIRCLNVFGSGSCALNEPRYKFCRSVIAFFIFICIFWMFALMHDVENKIYTISLTKSIDLTHSFPFTPFTCAPNTSVGCFQDVFHERGDVFRSSACVTAGNMMACHFLST